MRNLLFVSALIFLSSCGEGESYVDENGNVDGKLVYQKYCMICHGEKGDEGNSGSADLGRSLLNRDQMINTVRNGRGDMTPFDFLSEDEIEAVIDYVETLKK